MEVKATYIALLEQVSAQISNTLGISVKRTVIYFLLRCDVRHNVRHPTPRFF